MGSQLWLLRHGEAVPHESKPDDERELTPHGRAQAEAAGAALARLGVSFDVCYTSPKLRAVETARLACRALKLDPVVAAPLAGRFDRADALDLLAGLARVLVVGHEPSFSQVVHDFTGAKVDFEKGGVAGLRSSGELLVLLRAGELAAIAA